MRTARDPRHDLLTLLALCPLLGATRSLAMAAGLCIVVVACAIATELLQRVFARVMAAELKVATALLLWTGAVATAHLTLDIFWPGLHQALGIYLPLLVPVGLLRFQIARDARMQTVLYELLLFCAAALALGGLRQWAGDFSALALLPPGGLILAGLLLAARNSIGVRRRGSDA